MNEVPSPNGGSYWEGDLKDARDHKRPMDANAEHRAKMVSSVVQSLANRVIDESKLARLVNHVIGGEIEKQVGALAETLRTELDKGESLLNEEAAATAVSSSDIRLITEYGRAVHGEMDAILTCARLGISVRGTYLYVTTFPCHNCTRHIIASGVRRVYYVEPYPKSKARDLHSDAICFDEREAADTGKIPFLPFVGIGPRRYLDFFSLDLSSGRHIQRKSDDQKPISTPKNERPPRVPLIPLSYLEREDKLLNDYRELLEKLEGKSRTA